MDNNSFDEVYRKYRKLVIRIAYDMLGDPILAQDICQDVFMKISEERIKYAPSDQKMRNYLSVATRNRVYDWNELAYNRREFCLNMDNYIAVTGNIPLRKVCMEELALRLFDELRKKNEQWYEIVLRLDVYDEEQEIVARDMNISHNLLRSKYHRARNWIKKNFATEYEEIKWY